MMIVFPPPRFRRFERVRVLSGGRHRLAVPGETGVVIWLDFFHSRVEAERHWMCLVFMADRGRYVTLSESDLESTGEFDSETSHLGQAPEVSFDLVMEDDMDFVEGTYRLPGEFWRVMVFGKWDGPTLQWTHQIWPSNNPWRERIDGLAFHVPMNAKLNREHVLMALSQALNVRQWIEVHGPDSMVLR